MNRFFIVAAMLFSILFLNGCGKGEEGGGTVTINFKLKYGANNLVMLNKYEYPFYGYPITFNRFSFFLSDVNLASASGSQPIEDIAYLDLSNAHATSASAAQGFDFVIKNVKPGNYTGMTFSIGVPALSNGKTPADFNEKPLSNQAEYWGDWKSYIFTRTEGQIDKDKDGKYDGSFSLHTGANIAFRTLRITKAVTIVEGNDTKIEMEIDLSKQFSGSKIYDINTHPQIHSQNQGGQVAELIDNLIKAFAVK